MTVFSDARIASAFCRSKMLVQILYVSSHFLLLEVTGFGAVAALINQFNVAPSWPRSRQCSIYSRNYPRFIEHEFSSQFLKCLTFLSVQSQANAVSLFCWPISVSFVLILSSHSRLIFSKQSLSLGFHSPQYVLHPQPISFSRF